MKETEITCKKGYSTLLSSGYWKIAISNSEEKEIVKDISRHLETDESFILLQGSGYIITAKENDGKFEFDHIEIKPSIVYTVEKDEWHAHKWDNNTKVLIIENSDTSDLNSEKYILTEEERNYLNSL